MTGSSKRGPRVWCSEEVGSQVLCLCCSVHRLYNGRAKGRQFGSKCNSGDRIGCGIEPVSFDVQTAQIFFTKNGKRVSGKSWVGFKWLEAIQEIVGMKIAQLGLAQGPLGLVPTSFRPSSASPEVCTWEKPLPRPREAGTLA